MVATVVLTIVDTSNWVDVFFYVTMALVVMLNVVNGIFQNSIYGLAAKLPMRYANAVILGSNISGTFVSLVNILTIWMSPNMRIAAVYYFVAAIVVLLVCFDTYLALPLNVSASTHFIHNHFFFVPFCRNFSVTTFNQTPAAQRVENAKRFEREASPNPARNDLPFC